MAMPTDVGIVDTMIGFPAKDFEHYEFIRKQLKDSESAEFDFPVEYMFKGVPKEKYGAADPIGLTLGEMDAYGVEWGLIGCEGEVNRKALADHPAGSWPPCQIDANDIMGAVRKIRPLQGGLRHPGGGHLPGRVPSPRSQSTTPSGTPCTPPAATSTSPSSCARACPVPGCPWTASTWSA